MLFRSCSRSCSSLAVKHSEQLAALAAHVARGGLCAVKGWDTVRPQLCGASAASCGGVLCDVWCACPAAAAGSGTEYTRHNHSINDRAVAMMMVFQGWGMCVCLAAGRKCIVVGLVLVGYALSLSRRRCTIRDSSKCACHQMLGC